jgi:cysteine desulfurase
LPWPSLVRTLYLDFNATTPLDPAVREAMLPFLGEEFGNPSSVHHVGRRVRAVLDEAHERVARVLGCRAGEVIFTSGGTESNNAAILGSARAFRAKGRHLITSAIEHRAVLRCFEHLQQREGFEVTVLRVDSAGRINPEDLRRAIRPETILVSLMAANNEIGTVQAVGEFGIMCRERGVLFHTDAVQWFGKLPFAGVPQFQADLVSLCAHKFHGPKGVGLLFVRSPTRLDPLLFGGPQEGDRRPGTENPAACVGLAEAMERFIQPPVFPGPELKRLTTTLASELAAVPGIVVVGCHNQRLPNTIGMTIAGADSISLLAALDLEGICASSGSACSAGSVSPSHVLQAIGVAPEKASSFLRLSLGRSSTSADIATVSSVLPRIIERIRAASNYARFL